MCSAVDGNDDFAQINAQVTAWLDIDAVDRNTARDDRSAAKFLRIKRRVTIRFSFSSLKIMIKKMLTSTATYAMKTLSPAHLNRQLCSLKQVNADLTND